MRRERGRAREHSRANTLARSALVRVSSLAFGGGTNSPDPSLDGVTERRPTIRTVA